MEWNGTIPDNSWQCTTNIDEAFFFKYNKMDVKQIWQKDVACSDDRDLNTRGEGEIPLTKSKQSETNVHHAGTVSEGHEYKGWDQESHTLK